MASAAADVTLVVSVLEGRQFPRRKGQLLAVRARFAGEELGTDPVDHGLEELHIQNELAWLLPRRTLQEHRAMRTHIKLQCIAQSAAYGTEEDVGFVMLDLRTTQAHAQWYPLLSTRYPKAKPELLVQITVEYGPQQTALSGGDGPVSGGNLPEGTPLSPTRGPDAAPASDTLPADVAVAAGPFQPVLGSDGAIHIGDGTDGFVLAITLAFATNLQALKPDPAIDDAATGTGTLDEGDAAVDGKQFGFVYSVLGQTIRTELFHSLVQPEFQAERASLRVQGRRPDLTLYLQHLRDLKVYLCCGEQVLGAALIPLAELVSPGGGEGEHGLRMVEGAFPLHASQFPLEASAAAVGVCVSLRGDAPGARAPTSQLGSAAGGPHGYEPMPGDSSAGYSEIPALEQQQQQQQQQEQEHLARVLQSRQHFYSVTVDLRSVSGLTSGPSTSKIYVRYSYPFFGSAAPFITHPPVEVPRQSQRPLPESYCAFEFAASPTQLHTQFTATPLNVEVIRSDQYESDELVGVARVDLAALLMPSGRVAASFPVVSPATTQKSAELQAILTLTDRGDAGSITPPLHGEYGEDGDAARAPPSISVMEPEDGPFHAPGPALQRPYLAYEQPGTQAATGGGEPSPALKGHAPVPPFGGGSAHAPHPLHFQQPPQPPPMPMYQGGGAVSLDPREQPQYKAALELELWKQEQEEAFKKSLEEKEDALMKTLAEEWKLRDKQRELLVNRKVVEYERLEGQLKHALVDLEDREKQIVFQEQQLEQQQRVLEVEHEKRLNELRDASRRLEQDMRHQTELQQLKAKEQERVIEQLQGDAATLNKRYRDLEEEYVQFRQDQRTAPKAHLEAQISKLVGEAAEAQRRLEQCSQAKQRYKAQWTRALQEVAAVKQREETAQQERLRREQKELQHMRLQYLAREERDVIESEKQELKRLRRELTQLRDVTTSAPLPAQPSAHPAPSGPKHGDAAKLSASSQQMLRRLMAERSSLVGTGVYQPNDVIIRELDDRIRALNPAHVP